MKAESSGIVISVDMWVVNTSKGEETSKPEHSAGAGTIVLESPGINMGKLGEGGYLSGHLEAAMT